MTLKLNPEDYAGVIGGTNSKWVCDEIQKVLDSWLNGHPIIYGHYENDISYYYFKRKSISIYRGRLVEIEDIKKEPFICKHEHVSTWHPAEPGIYGRVYYTCLVCNKKLKPNRWEEV